MSPFGFGYADDEKDDDMPHEDLPGEFRVDDEFKSVEEYLEEYDDGV